MNKAFIKEREDAGDRCPSCGSPGQKVYAATLEAQLTPELRAGLSDSAYFCATPTCPVAYFDQFERSISADSLPRAVYPKDPEAPICACFGLTQDEVEADARAGVVDRIRNHLKRARSDEAHCSTMAANGQSCVAAVQRCYMQFHGR